jgi:hypothetical protein
MKRNLVLVVICLFLFINACGSVCPEGSITYVTGSPQDPASEIARHTEFSQEIELRTLFGAKPVMVDKVVHGSFCNDTWSGTIYVACDIEIPEWEENPTFLKDCDLTIEEGTTVYVAQHNDAMYPQGCSCHE